MPWNLFIMGFHIAFDVDKNENQNLGSNSPLILTSPPLAVGLNRQTATEKLHPKFGI